MKHLTNSSDFDDETIATVQNLNPPPLQNMDTVDDIDEDEIFINELMAMHPNEEDVIVEDIENNSQETEHGEMEESLPSEESVNDEGNVENSDDGVRNIRI